MKQYVWLLIENYEYDGDKVLGVYSSEAAVEHDRAVAEEKKQFYYINYWTERMELQ